MNISYAITVHNEHTELTTLLNVISRFFKETDEIVIVTDKSTKLVDDVIDHFHFSTFPIKCRPHLLNGDFATHKNFLIEQCSKDYIFQIDADEYPNDYIMTNLHTILTNNSHIDLFRVPRINVVNGITDQHIKKWNWGLKKNGWINFPDYQSRLFRNNETIKWINKVHEVITGNENITVLPPREEYCLYHIKDIHKQETQNELYEKIIFNK